MSQWIKLTQDNIFISVFKKGDVSKHKQLFSKFRATFSRHSLPPPPHTMPPVRPNYHHPVSRSVQSLRSILPSVSTISLWMPITPCHSPAIPPSSANQPVAAKNYLETCPPLPIRIQCLIHLSLSSHACLYALTHTHAHIRSSHIFWAQMHKIFRVK